MDRRPGSNCRNHSALRSFSPMECKWQLNLGFLVTNPVFVVGCGARPPPEAVPGGFRRVHRTPTTYALSHF